MAYTIYESGDSTIIEGLKNFELESILECGQCFRWNRNYQNDYTGVVGNRAVRAVQKENILYLYNSSVKELNDFWSGYFDLKTDYGNIIKELSAEDEVMQRAAGFAPGIRILRQPLFETLISFIISANNSIPNIKRIIPSLAAMYGERINYDMGEYYSFPNAEVLSLADVADIRLSKAGYRSEYIKKTAEAFMKHPVTSSQLRDMNYQEAKALLMEFTGVGAKVADCTLLFSGAHVTAFPVDVWVKRIMETLYLEKDTPLKKISEDATMRFGNLAGYAQQYLFYYARSNL